MTLPTKWLVLRLKWGEGRKHVYLDDDTTTEFFTTGVDAQNEARSLATRYPGELFAVAEITGTFTGKVEVAFESA